MDNKQKCLLHFIFSIIFEMLAWHTLRGNPSTHKVLIPSALRPLCPIHQVVRSKVSVEEYGIISKRWVCFWKPHVPLWSKRWEVPCHHCLCMTATSGFKWGVTFLLSEHQAHDSYLGKKMFVPWLTKGGICFPDTCSCVLLCLMMKRQQHFNLMWACEWTISIYTSKKLIMLAWFEK